MFRITAFIGGGVVILIGIAFLVITAKRGDAKPVDYVGGLAEIFLGVMILLIRGFQVIQSP